MNKKTRSQFVQIKQELMKKIKNSKSGISEYKKNLVELLDGINPRTRIINKKK
jgi:hypothetical protein